MYFSNYNKKITFTNNWDGSLDVCGEGMVCREDLSVYPSVNKKWKEEYTAINLEKGITGVGEGFLEAFPAMDTLIIHYTVGSIAVTPALQALFKRNHVVVRGWYDSYGELFAQENGLAFIHADIVVGWAYCEERHEGTRLEIRFDENGRPYRFYDDICPGISAGNNGGGTYTRELDEDFYAGETLESFAEWLTRFSNDILKNEDLKRYFETANKRLRKQ